MAAILETFLRLFVVLPGVMWRPYWRLCLRLFVVLSEVMW